MKFGDSLCKNFEIMITCFPNCGAITTWMLIDYLGANCRVDCNRTKHEGTGRKITFVKMDCEALEFPSGSFDVVFDGGTFSSLDFPKALGEIVRVLRPNGVLVGIETFGHNPLANVKRAYNKITGKRTAWAASHIMRQKEIALLRDHFEQIELHYFHLISLFCFPFLGLPGGRFLLQLGQLIDRAFLRVPFLEKYAFKVVFICHGKKAG